MFSAIGLIASAAVSALSSAGAVTTAVAATAATAASTGSVACTAAGLAAAGYGVSKSIQAKNDSSTASSVSSRANSVQQEAVSLSKQSHEECASALEELGRRKMQVLRESFVPFMEEFGKLQNVQCTDSALLREVLPQQNPEDYRALYSVAQASAAEGAGAALSSGALTAWGAYSLVGMLGTASTGTAIGTLSGAAATNATLAWLGGGSLAAGGLGMAGGTLVLGTLFAGPALAVMGAINASRAEEAKHQAYANLSRARENREKAELQAAALRGIAQRAGQFSSFLSQLNPVFRREVEEMSRVIGARGTDLSSFALSEQESVARACALAYAVKSLLNTAIMGPDGSLTPESAGAVEAVRGRLQAGGVDVR